MWSFCVFGDMLRIAMSSIMRCLSGEICVVIGELRRRCCTCGTDDRTDGRDDFAQGYVAEVILCDVSRMALLSHIPHLGREPKWNAEGFDEISDDRDIDCLRHNGH